MSRTTVPNVAFFESLTRPDEVVAVYWAVAAGSPVRRPDAIHGWRTEAVRRPSLPWTLNWN